MNRENIRKAVNEAYRFLEAYEEFIKKPDHYTMPERAALRRASLDLTRALAKMRER